MLPLTQVAAKRDKGSYAGHFCRSTSACAEQRPKAAAHRRAAPTARRLGCRLRKYMILHGFGQHKALQIEPWIAAPRPDAARLCAFIHPPQSPQTGHWGSFANWRLLRAGAGLTQTPPAPDTQHPQHQRDRAIAEHQHGASLEQHQNFE